MSLSRQLRRAAERAQRKQQDKASKNLAVESSALSGAQISESAETAAAVGSVAEEQPAAQPERTALSVSPRTGAGGPRTPEGKAVACLNNLKHGLAGAFRVLQSESQSDFDAAHEALISEHQPTTPTESELVRRMAEHAWLSRRAQNLQDKAVMDCNGPLLALFLRYQTTNDRGFRSCLNELFRLRREQRAALRSADSQKEFESQSPESKNREAEFHAARVCLANARAAHLEMDTELRSQIDAPIPGYSSVPVEQIKELFQVAMMRLQHETEVKTAA